MPLAGLNGSSQKSWSLICQLGAAQCPCAGSKLAVIPNQIANHLLKVAKAPVDRVVKRQAHDKWWRFAQSNPADSKMEPFTSLELDKVLKDLKTGTAPGYDRIAPEFMKCLGPCARE